jgi:hypothetical protein
MIKRDLVRLVRTFFEGIKKPSSGKTSSFAGLDATATYKVTDLDAGVPNIISGRDSMQKGLHVEVAGEPGAAIIIYKKIR